MSQSTSAVIALLVPCLAVAIGCESRAAAEVAPAFGIDTVDGIEVAWSSGSGMWGAEPIEAELFLSVGELEGDAEYLLGRVAGIAVDAAERLYVLDQMASAVRVYDPTGRHLATIGRVGRGPGEFTHPFGLAFAPDGDLLVRDLERVTRFSAPSDGEIPSRASATWPGLIYPPSWDRTARVTAAGDYLYPRDHHPAGEPSRYLYVRFSPEGETLDTLEVPHFSAAPAGFAWFRTGPGGGRMLQGLNYPPFHPLPTWDATPRGTVLSGDGSEYLITETGPRSDTIRRIERRGVARERIPARERNDSLAAMRMRLDSIPVALDQVEGLHQDVGAGRVAEVFPAFIGLHAAGDGWIWAERWPLQGRSRFDVFDEDGRFLGTVVLPVRLDRDVAPVFTGNTVYGVISDPDTEVQRVVGMSFSAR